jgi:transposase
MSTTSLAGVVPIGVGIDTARYGHRVSFLRGDRQPAAPAFTFTESHAGYQQLRQAFEQLQRRHGQVHFHIRLDAAGQYAVNLERFLRTMPFEKTFSIGQPKRNRDYCKVHFPKRKADAVEAEACARFAIVEQPPASPDIPAAFLPLRELVSALESQVKQTTRLVNQLHNRLARVFPELATTVSDIGARWVLRLLQNYPSAAKIAAAREASLLAIPHLSAAKAAKIQAAARQTVASAKGPLFEDLLRQSVQAVQHAQKYSRCLRDLVVQACDALPPGPHRQIETIPGIGKITAAVLISKLIGLEHFDTPESVVGYFGVFPEEYSSGVDKFGRPVPPGTRHMSRKGNDLVRRYLWNAAKAAIVHNPVIRSFFARKRAAGKRGDVALGHCMQKLLHLVFAVWKTNRPFTPPMPTSPAATVTPPAATAAPQASTAPAVPLPTGSDEPATPLPPIEKAVGRKGQSPEKQAVTTAAASVPTPPAACNTPALPAQPNFPVDFAELRRQISIEQVLRELKWWDCLRGHGAQRRGPCPLHDSSQPRSRSFSVHVHKNVFQCFDANCGAHGNALDLWAQKHGLTLLAAAQDLAQRFALVPGTEKRNP